MPLTVIRENVTGNYFQFLGLVPAVGRLFTSDDVPKSGPPQVAVVSWQFWQNALAADPSVLGKRIVVNGTLPLAIVGVAPVHTSVRAQNFKPASGYLWKASP